MDTALKVGRRSALAAASLAWASHRRAGAVLEGMLLDPRAMERARIFGRPEHGNLARSGDVPDGFVTTRS